MHSQTSKRLDQTDGKEAETLRIRREVYAFILSARSRVQHYLRRNPYANKISVSMTDDRELNSRYLLSLFKVHNDLFVSVYTLRNDRHLFRVGDPRACMYENALQSDAIQMLFILR